MTHSRQRLMERITSDKLLAAFGVLAMSATLYYTAAFFATVNSTLSDFTSGDIIWVNQAFYNFTHGRALQTSVYWWSGEGVIFNPYFYSSQIAMHVNWFPYVFSPIYRLTPNINGLYAIVLLWNYLGIAYFTWKTLKHFSTDHMRTKFFFMLALLTAGSFFRVFTYKSLFLLFAGPLITALFYFLVSRQKFAFLTTAVLLCLVQEDAAMFAVTFSAYAFLFHRKDRSYAYWLFGIAAVYLALVIFVIMPATKYDLTLATRDSSDIIIRFKKMINGDYPPYWRGLVPMFCFIFGGFGMLAAFFPRTAETDWKEIAALVFLAPLTHWVITLWQGPAHHPLPVLVATYAAMTLYAGTARYENRSVQKAPVILGAFLLGLLLIASNVQWMHRNLVSPFSYSRLIASDREIQSNEALLAAAASIPPSASVCYWTNSLGVEGFLSSRSDVWRYSTNFDKADYLLIQKDADPGGRNYDGAGTRAPTKEAAARLKKSLVDEAGTHVVALENNHFIFLKRKERFNIPMPDYSLGFGWIKNIRMPGTKKAS